MRSGLSAIIAAHDSAHIPENTEHTPKDDTVINNNRFHFVILGLKTDMAFLLVKAFDRSRVIDQSYDNLTVLRSSAAVHKNIIPVHNTGIDHGCSVYL